MNKPKMSEGDRELARSLYQKWWTKEDIARSLGVPRLQVYRLLYGATRDRIAWIKELRKAVGTSKQREAV